jgi:DNA-binding SARP family transcriptional activator
MRELHVSLLGELVVRSPGELPVDFATRKEKELFCILLTRRRRSHTRAALANLLWYDATAEQSKRYLRTALWHLRKDLAYPSDPDPLITVEGERVQLSPQVDIRTDVEVIEQAFGLVKPPSKERCTPRVAAQLTGAVGLYKGDFLEGWCEEWCLYERERVRQMYFQLVNVLIAYHEARGAFGVGRELGLQLLSKEPTQERTYRQLMRLYYLGGDRCGALRQYQRCVEVLCAELDVRPSALTEALYEEIRADRLGPACQAVSDPSNGGYPTRAVDSEGGSLQAVLDNLESIQAKLEVIQRQLRRELKAPVALDLESDTHV